MPKMIQVRNVPDDLHRELKRRAKLRGLTLTDYLKEILEREVASSDRQQWLARVLQLKPVDLGNVSAAELVREARREAGRE